MIENKLQTILSYAKDTKQPYPTTFNQLKDTGVEMYEVHLESYKNVYRGTFGEWSEPRPGDFPNLTVSENFNKAEIKRSLQSHQAGATTFAECMLELAGAGVSHYRVKMNDRTVTYYSKTESDSLQEYVPDID